MNYPPSNRLYFPVGTKLLIRVVKENERAVLVPDGVRNPNEPPIAEILAVGELANMSLNEKVDAAMAKYSVGDLIAFTVHPKLAYGINQEQETLIIERDDVVAKVVRQ